MTRHGPIANFEEHAAAWPRQVLDGALLGKAEVVSPSLTVGRPSHAPRRSKVHQAPEVNERGSDANALREVSMKIVGLSAVADGPSSEGPAPKTVLMNMFNFLGLAILVVDSMGRVLDGNECAHLALGEELRLVDGRLRASNHRVSRRLSHLIAQATSSQAMAPVVIPRNDRYPLLVYVFPLMNDVPGCPLAAAIVMVLDLDRRKIPSPLHLREVFGLTSAESKLAALLAGGDTLDTAAELLRISKETARSHLKTIFAKTGVQQQSQLVALLARLPPVLEPLLAMRLHGR